MNRNDDQETAYFLLGEDEVTLSVDAEEKEIEQFVQKIEKTSVIGVKLNGALKQVTALYPMLEKAVLTKDCFAINAATC